MKYSRHCAVTHCTTGKWN